MKTFDWKDKYIEASGLDITATGRYYSLLGTKDGDGRRNNPIYPERINTILSQPYHILSGGHIDLVTHMVQEGSFYYIGQGANKTHINLTLYGGNYKKHCSLQDLNCDLSTGCSGYGISLINCILNNIDSTFTGIYTTRSIIMKGNIEPGYKDRYILTTVVSCNVGNQLSNLALYNKSNIAIQSSTINNFHSRYVAFNNCSFAIGSESKATPLTGSTSEELKQNFVDRCEEQNIKLIDYDEYGEKNKMGRWIFSSTSILGEYNTLEESEIDVFAKKRGLFFGHTSQTYKQLPIVVTEDIPGSFAPSTPRSLINVASGSLTLNASADTRNTGYIDSKIIYLGGKHQLTALNIHDNLPIENGVSVDSVYSFGEKTETVEPDINYIVRSINAEQAKIRYNEVEYNSSLIGRDNIFRGIAGVSTFTPISNNVMVLPVTDFANHQTLRVRLVSDIPSGEIRGTSSLQKDYWYIVVPDNMQDTSGSITYKGIKHPCFDSFVADSTSNFTVNGACHLRRCWRKDYTESDETIDRTFWQSRQKPLYFDVIPDDLRALRKNNTITENEIMKDSNQQYIGSGHIDFYNSINGANGVKLPAFNLVGTFLQIQIPISTLNPM